MAITHLTTAVAPTDMTTTGATRWNEAHVLTSPGLIMPKAVGVGIQVDTDIPTWGWRDLEGVEMIDSVVPPVLSTYRTPIREYSYTVGRVLDIRFHIPHDLVPNSDLFIHFHWSHIGTAISGNIVTTFTSTYAKGHNQATFPANKAVTSTYNTTNITTTPQYQHRIEEVQWSSAGGSASLFDSALIEPDGLILMNFTMTTPPTITGGTTNAPFVHRVDMHYQSTNISTKQKAFPFYT